MSAFLLTRHRTGPSWDPTRPMEAQSDWEEHARVMDALVARGVLIIGGPAGAGERVVLVCEAATAQELLDALEDDPWTRSHLIDEVEPLSIRIDARHP
ncbi:MAG TPA: hypothetical protein PLS29_03900 [Acidimicrobiales bacterium]|nr:MAG: hypothetical protein B7Z69_00820 [Actinobacteria bacterium 21-73-9]HQU26157.1 hypothetical protein [Acidimicrobiales bacterium]